MKANIRKPASAPANTPFRDKPTPPPANRGRSGPPPSRAELAEWVQKAKDLPDIRWDKVKALREAIQSDAFDLDKRLAELGDKLPQEVIDFFRQSAK